MHRKHRARWFQVLIGTSLLVLAGCGDDEEKCSNVDCSGHGLCAVADGETAICVCDVGYVLQGSTSCVEIGEGPVGGCLGAADCPGELCDYVSGACVPESPARCVPPPDEGGTQMKDENCGLEPGYSYAPCGAGLTCVPKDRRYDEATGEYGLPPTPANSGASQCLPACNPCEQGCAVGDCIALPGEGGFCAGSGLIGEGQVCGFLQTQKGYCGGGTWCAPGQNTLTCDRICRPDDLTYAGLSMYDTGRYMSASSSQDCAAGSVCQVYSRGLDSGTLFTCVPGVLVPTGAACGFGTDNASCAYPDGCMNSDHGDGYVTAGVCSPLLAACDSSSCPTGTHCRDIDNGVETTHVCVGEHVIGYNILCGDDLDCQVGLRCTSWALHPTMNVCQ